MHVEQGTWSGVQQSRANPLYAPPLASAPWRTNPPARARKLGGGVGNGCHVPPGAHVLVLVAQPAGAWGRQRGVGLVAGRRRATERQQSRRSGATGNAACATCRMALDDCRQALTLVNAPAVDAVKAGA